MASEPALHLRMLVGRVVIDDHMDLLASRGPHNRSRARTSATPDGGAGRRTWRSLTFQRVESGEQRGRAMALVVVGHGSAAAFLHRQAGLGAVQCLNLALFVG